MWPRGAGRGCSAPGPPAPRGGPTALDPDARAGCIRVEDAPNDPRRRAHSRRAARRPAASRREGLRGRIGLRGQRLPPGRRRGPTACHRVAAAAVRAGFDDFTPFPTPDRPERFFTVHLRARVSSGLLAEVGGLDWLPQSGITRGFDEGLWARPGAVLTGALRRAARGLRPRPAPALGAVAGRRPQARGVE